MRISIIGAYGYTGRLICEELAKREIRFQAIGRNLEKLQTFSAEFDHSVPFFQFDIRIITDVEKIIECSDIIINCAGPFTEESPLLLEQCVYAGKIYIDITGEVDFVKQSREKWNDIARTRGALIIHGCAFESLFVDLGVQYISKGASRLKAVQTFYWFNKMVVSPGTKMTMKLSKYRGFPSIENGNWSLNQASKKWKVAWGSEEQYHSIVYPLPEIAFMHWEYRVDHCCSYLLLDELEAKYFNFEKNPKPITLDDVDHLRKSKKEGPTESVRKDQKNIIIIRITGESGSTEYLSISSSDMYMATAKSVVFTVEALLKFPLEWSGVIAPATIFKGKETDILAKLGAKLNEIIDIHCELLSFK
jgi:short subunit dehydrogenase-like uncharacterized protein